MWSAGLCQNWACYTSSPPPPSPGGHPLQTRANITAVWGQLPSEQRPPPTAPRS